MAADHPVPEGIDWRLTTWEGSRREQLRRWASLPLERIILAIEEMQDVADEVRGSHSDARSAQPGDDPAKLSALSPDALLDALIADEDRAPRALIEECARRGEAMVEALRGAIGEGRAWRDDGAAGDWWLMLHAAMILGRIGSASAGLELARLMRRFAAEEDDSLQDWLAGHWPALFANKPPAAIEAARRLSEDRALDWYIRHQGITVVADAALRAGARALDECLDWLAAIASDESEDWDVRASVASVLLDFPRERHRVTLERIVDAEMQSATNEGAFGIPRLAPADIDNAFARGRDEPGWKRRGEPWRFYSPRAIAHRQERWAKEDAEEVENEDDPFEEPPLPYVRATAKIGRNDPCPCGSGKKYKKCCLRGTPRSAIEN